MAKPMLEINLTEPCLNYKGKEIRLEDNFKGISNTKDVGIHMHYEEKPGFNPEDEGEKIYNFLEQQGLEEEVIVSPTSNEVYNAKDHPAVTLMGDFHYYVSR